jgi:hypothetical protein
MMKRKLTPQEDAKLFKNRVKKFFGVYQYINPDLPHESEYMRVDKDVEDNKLAYSILYGIVFLFALMVGAVMLGIWIAGKINS